MGNVDDEIVMLQLSLVKSNQFVMLSINGGDELQLPCRLLLACPHWEWTVKVKVRKEIETKINFSNYIFCDDIKQMRSGQHTLDSAFNFF